jgi:site-specific recombinase XerD
MKDNTGVNSKAEEATDSTFIERYLHAEGKVMGATGDLSLVMRALGHSSAQTAMIYQHPSLERVRSVVNEGYAEALSSHNSRHTAIM